MSILDEILEKKREAVRRHQEQLSVPEARGYAEAAPAPLDFAAALRGDMVRVIAEIKRASPSKGDLNIGLDPRAQARLYTANGAAAVSVLCEEDFFKGSLDDLLAVREELDRAAPGVPALCKDFLYDEYQVWQARVSAADSVLLIMAMLEPEQARFLIDVARSVGMEPLVEVHDEGELEAALAIGARIVGINNRDLRTFETDLVVTERLLPRVPAGVVAVSESGFAARADVERIARLGADAILVGESAVTAPDPAALLQSLATVPRSGRQGGLRAEV